MPVSDLYMLELRDRLERRPHGTASVKLRRLLTGFGCHRRTDANVAAIRRALGVAGIEARFSLTDPPTLEDHVTLRLDPAPTAREATIPRRGLAEVGDGTPLERIVAAVPTITTDYGSGSGFIVDPAGLLVTARHVVDDDDGLSLRTVTVHMTDGRDFEAMVFGSHRVLDFALAWLPDRGPFPAVTLGVPAQLRYGQTVFSIGSPEGFSRSVSRGVISNPAQVQRVTRNELHEGLTRS